MRVPSAYPRVDHAFGVVRNMSQRIDAECSNKTPGHFVQQEICTTMQKSAETRRTWSALFWSRSDPTVECRGD
jgi:hypothetical protein